MWEMMARVESTRPPGVRSVSGEFAAAHCLALSAAIIVKYRDARTDARVALEEALR